MQSSLIYRLLCACVCACGCHWKCWIEKIARQMNALFKPMTCSPLVANKDESTTKTTTPNTITGSVFDLKPSPSTSTRRTETLHHHQHQHRPYRKATNKSTLNKTDEHCRSLFNLFPTSIRSRQPTSKNRGIDAVSINQQQTSVRARREKKERRNEREEMKERSLTSSHHTNIRWFRLVKWQFIHRSSRHIGTTTTLTSTS